MAQLTWREVNAPDFSQALNGVRGFNEMLNQALGTAKSAVDRIDQDRTQALNKNVMAKLLNTNQSGAVDQVISEIFGSTDPSKLSDATMAALAARKGQLLGVENAQLGLDKGKYEFGREQSQNTARDAASPIQQQMLEAYAKGDLSGAQRIFDTNKGTLSKLGYNDFSATMRDGFALARDRQGYDQSGTRFGWDVQDHNAQTEAEAALQRIDGVAFDPDSRLQALRGLGLSPKAFSLAVTKIGALPDTGTGAGPAIAAAVGGGGYGDFVTSLESGGNANARNPGSSATGLYQFTNGTWLNTVKQAKPAWANGLSDKQILGLRTDPGKATEMEAVLRNQNVSALQNANVPITNGNVYAAHHFGVAGGVKFAKASGNTPMTAILSPEQIAANPYLRGMTKNDALGNWSQRSGIDATSIADLATASDVAGIGRTTGRMQRNTGTINDVYVKAASDNRDPSVIIGEVAKDPRLTGMGTAYVDQQIQQIRAKAAEAGKPMNEAVAGEILKRSVVTGAWTRNMPYFLGGGSDQGGYKVDGDKIDQLIKSYSVGDVERGVINNVRSDRATASAAALTAQAQQAAARYQQAVYANQNQGKNIPLGPLYLAMVAATQAAKAAQDGIINDPASTAYNSPPPKDNPGGGSRGGQSSSGTGRRPPASPPPAARPTAYATDNRGRYVQQGSAGSRARAAEAVSSVPRGIGRIIAEYNPAALLLRAALDP